MPFDPETGDFNYVKQDRIFLRDDIPLEFEILDPDDGELVYLETVNPDGSPLPNPNKGVVDVTGWEFVFTVALKDTSAALIEVWSDASPQQISITGTYNAARATNTQRVLVTLDDSDTDALDQKTKTYRYALKRMNVGFERTLASGSIQFRKAPTPAS